MRAQVHPNELSLVLRHQKQFRGIYSRNENEILTDSIKRLCGARFITNNFCSSSLTRHVDIGPGFLNELHRNGDPKLT